MLRKIEINIPDDIAEDIMGDEVKRLREEIRELKEAVKSLKEEKITACLEIIHNGAFVSLSNLDDRVDRVESVLTLLSERMTEADREYAALKIKVTGLQKKFKELGEV